jgi:phosphatidylinositol alpha-mannosyltransferase
LRHRDLVPKAVCVGTFHSYREVSRAYYYGRSIFMRFFKRLDSMIVVSEAARQYHMRYFQANYAVIPNGVDVSRFADPTITPIEQYVDGRPNILFVGRLEKRKGLPYLLEAFAQVRRVVPEARLLVVGAYDRLDKLPYLLQARQLGLSDVQFIGQVDDAELARYYRTATIFCAPSTGMESFGIILLEAMASSAPIVASDIDGYREVVTHGVEGVLVPPENPQALAEGLIALLNDPARRAAMGVAGRAKAERYDWNVVAGHVLEHYEELRLRLQPYQARVKPAPTPG